MRRGFLGAPAAGAAAIAAAHPALELELTADPSNRDLVKRDADLALRLARPEAGGDRVLARRVGTLSYGVFAAAGLSPPVAWIGYAPGFQHPPPARWTEAAAASRGEPTASLRVEDAETLLEAAAAGLGKAVLPRAIAARDPRLVALRLGEPPERPLWLLVHRDMARLARIRAVGDWIARTVAAAAPDDGTRAAENRGDDA